jgi:competence protein ComEA
VIPLKEFLKVIEEKGKIVILFLFILVVLLIILVFWQFFQKEPKEVAPVDDVYEELLGENVEETDVDLASAEEGNDGNEAESARPKEIIVDVKGAVQSPGVYTMTTNSRVVDAIEKAGGLSETAEQKAVNLAQVVEDQMVIYVPEEGEEGVDYGHLNPGTTDATGSTENIVNINTAEKEALMTLNGIGNSKADSILTYREENGNFKTIEEIQNVSGIGEATFANLKDFITVGP